MIYNLAIQFENDKFDKYCQRLAKKACKVELKEYIPARTTQQNRFLHVLFSLFALEFGWSLSESKTKLKRACGLFYEKNGSKFVRSTRDLNKEEMSNFIESIRNYSATQGCYLPDSSEYLSGTDNIDDYIKRNGMYL